MTEVLFCVSIGFVAYVVYVLVDEQKSLNTRIPEKPVAVVKASTPKPPRKKATTTKAKPAKAALTKAAPKPPRSSSDPIVTYLGKNGLTTIAKLSIELPESRRIIESRIDQLIQEGTLSLSTIRNAKAVALKA
jgi:flagellar basal body-associated protein FliL